MKTMQPNIPGITPSLVFDHQAEEAAAFYTTVFNNSKIHNVIRYGEGQPGPAGSVCVVAFQLDGQEFQAANGGPYFKFSEGVSLYKSCDTQEELDEIWEKLLEGGEAQQCGWLRDKFGVFWQIAPTSLWEIMKDPDPKKTERVLNAIFSMNKLDVAAIERAYAGE